MFPPPPLFCLLVFTNSYAGMWLKIPGIVESSHMRKERKTQCYLTLINVKKTVTCSFCLFFGRLSCELLHYNCSFQRIKKVRFEIHLKGSAQWCELPNRKKKGEPVLCAETDPEYRVLQVFGAHAWGHLAHWPTLSPHRLLVLGWTGAQEGSASGKSFTLAALGHLRNAGLSSKVLMFLGSPGTHRDWQCHLGGTFPTWTKVYQSPSFKALFNPRPCVWCPH